MLLVNRYGRPILLGVVPKGLGGVVDLGPTGGVVWSDDAEWRRRCQPEGCIICRSGAPLDVIAELPTCWVTAAAEAPLPGYVCVVARRHVVEPYQLPVAERRAFFDEAMAVAEAVASLLRPVKINYEIHGSTLPHLHLHIFPRMIDDPFVGGPIDPRTASFTRSTAELASLQRAVTEGRTEPA